MVIKIVFWICVLVAILIWIVESIIENKMKENSNESSRLVLKTLFSDAPGVPPEALNLIRLNEKLRKWTIPLISIRYILILVAITLRIWFI